MPPRSQPSGVALNTHRRFQELAELDLPSYIFLGLCAYLSVLLSWGWPIGPGQLDGFICSYTIYEKDPVYGITSYHTWFQQQDKPSYHGPVILDTAILASLAAENPYTFAFVRESLDLIAANHGIPLPVPELIGPGVIIPHASLPAPRADLQPGPRPQFQPLDLSDLQPWHDEKALRQDLGLQNRDELLAWVRQGWVFTIYQEYHAAVLDHWRTGARPDLHPGIRGSSARYIINAGLKAVQERHVHHLQERDRSNWTQDEHDVRFIVQVVTEGARPGRWWEHSTDTPAVCITAYRFLCWLRHIHRLSASGGAGSPLRRAADCRWYTQLQEERARRAHDTI